MKKDDKPVVVAKKRGLSLKDRIARLIHKREARWSGGKPRGSRKPVKIKDRSVAEAVIQDRD